MNWKKLERILPLINSIEHKVLKIPEKDQVCRNRKRFCYHAGVSYFTYNSGINREQNPSTKNKIKIMNKLNELVREYQIEDLININLNEDYGKNR